LFYGVLCIVLDVLSSMFNCSCYLILSPQDWNKGLLT